MDSFILLVCHDESKVMGNGDLSLRLRQCMESWLGGPTDFVKYIISGSKHGKLDGNW